MMNETGVRKPEVIEAAGGLVWRSTDNGEELAIIHRERYDDWTLPKGKRETGESWTQAALREVTEETGCKTELGTFAGGIIYKVDGSPKVVLYWHMRLIEDPGFIPNDEVDQLAWMKPKDAAQKMSYPAEISLLP